MKLTTLPGIALLSILPFFTACSEKEPEIQPEPRGGSMKIQVVHEVNGKPAVLDQYDYMNEAGDSFQITFLQHYLSNFEFHSTETGWVKKEFYRLVRIKNEASQYFVIEDLPFGNYDSVRFYIGIDSATNHNIDRMGELDPAAGMIWSWNEGYIFYMFEGKFINDNNQQIGFAYHLGGDEYLIKYELPIAQTKTLTVSQHEADLKLILEMDEIFASPHTINLNQVAPVSHTFDEPALSMMLIENMYNAYRAE